MTDERIAELRKTGVLIQKNKDYFTIKIGGCGGASNATLLRKVADLAEKFGDGSIHTTTRQIIDVYNIHKDNVEDAVKYMEENGIPKSISGPCLRSIVACPGDPSCRFSMENTQDLAQEIKARFGNFTGLNTKIKIAVTGCKNACAKPRENCIGLLPLGKGRWEISIGGKMGKKPRLATHTKAADNLDEVFSTIEKVLEWTRDNGNPKERLSDIVVRLESELPSF